MEVIKMDEFKLSPGDILVNIDQRKNLISSIRRWAVGPYHHVFMYIGKLGISVSKRHFGILRFPMLFESNGRGVVLQSLSNRYGQEVLVMRLRYHLQRRKITGVLEEAIKLASEPQSYYDYLCIIKFVLPRIIFEKLSLPLPLAWHRDARQICSEAVYEIFARAGVDEVLPSYCVPPLPGDFVTDSVVLEKVWRGILSERIA